jgi:hypothetical protein
MTNPNIAPEENQAYRYGNQDLLQQTEIAEYLNINISRGEILMDSFRTYNVILNLENTNNVITSCSYNFNAAVKSSESYNGQYILTVDPSDVGALDAINIKYPDLYQNGASWCTLVKTFNGYKLYEVDYP